MTRFGGGAAGKKREGKLQDKVHSDENDRDWVASVLWVIPPTRTTVPVEQMNGPVYKMSRQILYIWMVQGQEQRGWQRQGGRGSVTEGHSPESRLWQKGEIQAGNLQSKGHDLDHLWPGTKAPKSEVGRFWLMGTAHPQQKWSLMLTLRASEPLLSQEEPCPQSKASSQLWRPYWGDRGYGVCLI